jgi:uncharacterized protein
MDSHSLELSGAGLLFAGVLKGATGLGFATCALPFLVPFLGLKASMALIILPTLATNLSVTLTTGHARECTNRFAWLYAAMIPGIALGIGLLGQIEQRLTVSILGCTMVAYVAFALVRPSLKMSETTASRLAIPVGFLNGIMTGLTGSQVMPLVPYMLALNVTPAQTIQATNLGVMLASTLLAIGLCTTGVMTSGLFLLSSIAVAPAMVGVLIGNKGRSRIPTAQFRRLVLVVIGLSGFMMIIKQS